MKQSPKRQRKPKRGKSKAAPRWALWRGSIAFGLVNIPVILESAQEEEKLHFRLIDKRDHAPIGYRQYNKVTGKEVSRDTIIKGYEYEKNHYVLMGPADFDKANLKATRSIDIEDFVELPEIDFMLFERPYYILPQPGGEKAYVLLREALQRTQKAAIAKIVLHTVQHLVAILAREDYLILEILRFANEIKEIHEAHLLDPNINRTHASSREIAVAEQLVEGMTGPWKPEKYHNTYRDDLMKRIQAKIRRGATAEITEIEADTEAVPSNIVDLTSLLKKSLNAAKHTPRKRVKRGA